MNLTPDLSASAKGALLRRSYYFLKPYLPRSLRLGMRRVRARHCLRKYANTWPIDPESAAVPAGWPGWRDGKRFAVVLTHDVESQIGVDRCNALARVETEAGFRSSFNFIPEGEYRVTPTLRQDLTAAGFEVGVHDLKHDGKLYQSESAFRSSARQINEYLKEWGAVGFRSGFMHHNLSWIGQLNVLYDASTFDTDPFEPQPDGVRTIFPFLVEGTEGRKYVELPYTLVQDITIFVLLRERSISLWKQKLDWVADRGGMVLVNVHPDYVDFDGTPSDSEFPAALYRELLDYVRTKYRGEYWMALPKEVAAYAMEHEEGVACIKAA